MDVSSHEVTAHFYGGDIPQEVEHAIIDLGMPIEAVEKWARFRPPAKSNGPKWLDYWLEFFGMFVDHLPDPAPWPYWRLYKTGDEHKEGMIVQVWRTRVFYRYSPLYGQIIWHPETGEKTTIEGLERPHKEGDVMFIQRGIAFAKHSTRVGRIPNNEEDFIREAQQALEKIHREGLNMTQTRLAEYMALSEGHLKHELARFGLTGQNWKRLKGAIEQKQIE